MRCRSVLIACVLTGFLFCVILNVSLFAQTVDTGALSGTVTDPQGAVVPNVTVTATNLGTGVARTTKTAADGTYRFGLLTPGNYSVRLEVSGFESTEVPSVTITVTETAVLDRTLRVGGQQQTITVQGEAVAVQTESSTIGTSMTASTATDLPLSTRNYTNLLGMTAGANAAVSNTTQLGGTGTAPAVNGAATSQNNFQMDGAYINNWFGFNSNAGTVATGYFAGIPIPSPDAIQEFKIQTSTYDAGYGRNVGANVNLILKSGTNAFHGDAFEFFRNTVLNSNDFFRNFTHGSRLPLNQNQFGGVFGGPIKKNKLFFFLSYQQTQQKNGIATQGYSSVTLPPIPTGNRGTCPVGFTSASQCNAAGQAFIAALGNNTCPTNPANAAYVKFDKTSVGGLQIACDGSNINPVAIKLLQLQLASGAYYVPSSGSSNAWLPATFSDPSIYGEQQGIGNIDYIINDKNTLAFRFLQSPNLVTAPIGCATCLPGEPYQAQSDYIDANLKLTTILSNNLVNEVRVSFSRILEHPTEGAGNFRNSQVGITDMSPSLDYLTYIDITGVPLQMGNNWFEDEKLQNNAYLWADQISWTHGRHSIRTGFEVGFTDASINDPAAQIGEPTFTSFADLMIGRSGAAVAAGGNGTGISNVASLGGNCLPQCTVWRANGGNYVMDYRTPEGNLFVQDDFKVSSRLTLNLGLRMEHFSYVDNTSGGNWSGVWTSLVNEQPYPGGSPATGSLAGFVVPSNFAAPVPAGVYKTTSVYLTQKNPPLLNFGPRVGFAWQPLSTYKWVIRGGGGLYYDRPPGNILTLSGQGSPPYAVPIANTPNSTLAAPFVLPFTIPGPPNTPGWSPRWVNYSTDASSNLLGNTLSQGFKTPVTEEWNLNTQYEFLPTWVLEVGYVGSHGYHDPGQSTNGYGNGPPINTALLASPTSPLCTAGGCVTSDTIANLPLRLPLLGFSPIFAPTDSSGKFKFNSLQATVRKQLSHGLTLQAAYTWSRAFVDAFQGINAPPGAQPWAVVYAQNSAYRPQRLVVNYEWQIPAGNHSGVVGEFINGWSLSGVTTIQAGAPLTITNTTAGTGYTITGGYINQAAQLCPGMGKGNILASRSVTQSVINGLANGNGYFNPSVVNCAEPVVPASEGGDGIVTGFGNVGPGIVLGPGQNNWDMSLAKTTKVGGLREDASLQFRADFFNTFNHPQFSNPVTTANSGAFGHITSETVGPRIIQFGLKYLF